MPRYHHVGAAAPSPRSARYSHAVEANGLLFVTGQLPVDPRNPEADPPETIEEQAQLVFDNLALIAVETGFDLANTVFARIYLTEFDADYQGFNSVYDTVFTVGDRLPARTTVGVARLGRSARVEVDLIIYDGR